MELLVGPATFDVSSPVTGQLVEIREDEDSIVSAGAILGWVSVIEEEGSGENRTEL